MLAISPTGPIVKCARPIAKLAPMQIHATFVRTDISRTEAEHVSPVLQIASTALQQQFVQSAIQNFMSRKTFAQDAKTRAGSSVVSIA